MTINDVVNKIGNFNFTPEVIATIVGILMIIFSAWAIVSWWDGVGKKS